MGTDPVGTKSSAILFCIHAGIHDFKTPKSSCHKSLPCSVGREPVLAGPCNPRFTRLQKLGGAGRFHRAVVAHRFRSWTFSPRSGRAPLGSFRCRCLAPADLWHDLAAGQRGGATGIGGGDACQGFCRRTPTARPNPERLGDLSSELQLQPGGSVRDDRAGPHQQPSPWVDRPQCPEAEIGSRSPRHTRSPSGGSTPQTRRDGTSQRGHHPRRAAVLNR